MAIKERGVIGINAEVGVLIDRLIRYDLFATILSPHVSFSSSNFLGTGRRTLTFAA